MLAQLSGSKKTVELPVAESPNTTRNSSWIMHYIINLHRYKAGKILQYARTRFIVATVQYFYPWDFFEMKF